MSRLTSWKLPTLLLVLLAIAAFCFANDRFAMLLAAWAIALGGWWFSERPGGRPLPRWSVLTLVLSVVLWAAFRADTKNLDVSVFCEFITFVLLVKMWDRKRARDIAQLISLGVFLVIGAILDNNSLSVGLVVLACMPLCAWCVMALQIGAGGENRDLASYEARRSAAAAASAPAVIGPPPAPTRMTHATARRLIPITCIFTVLAFFIALAVFLIVPRGLAGGHFGSFGQAAAGMRTGFTDDVTLGLAGLISESQRTVLEASFTDGNTTSLGGEGQVYYLRGAVMGIYNGGRWSAGGLSSADDRAVRDNDRERIILQDIDLRESFMGNRDEGGPLFAVWCVKNINAGTEDVSRPKYGNIQYRRKTASGHLRYKVHSVEQQAPEVVTERGRAASFDSPAVREHASRVLQTAGIEPDPLVRPPAEDQDAVRILNGYLRGKFEYTTDINRPQNGEDPIEWFLSTERRGHCEYFASALTAMCQSVGINARLVAGYVATEYDDQRGVYTVRESNAHAWTEAEIARGVWLTYDPTPPVAFLNIHEPQQTWRVRIARVIDAVNDAWTNSVVMFDHQRQRSLLDPGRLRIPWFDGLARDAAEEFRETRGRSVFKYILITAAALACLAGLSIAAVRSASMLARRFARRSGAHNGPLDPQMQSLLQDAGFYSDALEALSDAGLPKPRSVPPLTFAHRVRTADPAAADAFESIASLYYRLRFARTPLTQAQSLQAREQLTQLRSVLARTTASARRSPPAQS